MSSGVSRVLRLSRSKGKRSFPYVLTSELTALAKGYGFLQSEVWLAFKNKGFIIAETIVQAEKIQKGVEEIPWK